MSSGSTDYRVARRAVLQGSVAATAFFALTGSLRARAAAPGARDDAFSDFVAEWSARAYELIESSAPNEDAYLFELCSALTRLERGAIPARSRTVFNDMGMQTGPVGGDAVFQLVEIEVEPGRSIPAHNHVGFSFVTLGVKGEALARHFEPVGEGVDPAREDVDFSVREVSSTLIRPGRTTTLTRTRANVHTFVAGEQGATLLDLGVRFPDPGEGPQTFSVLDIDTQARDAARRTFTARWIGNIYAKK